MKTLIKKNGQKFVDIPVIINLKPLKKHTSEIAKFIRSDIPKEISVIEHYKRTPLKWMRPDKSGNLVEMIS